MKSGAEIAHYIEPVACLLLGQPNTALSTAEQLRFGTNGSIAVEIGGEKRGTWFDHEHSHGGGVLDLVELKTGLAGRKAVDWIATQMGIELAATSKGRMQIAATYDYVDENGELRFQVVRLVPKDFRQRRPDGNGWAWGTKGVEKIPYRLPDIVRWKGERTVLIVEGEKDADNLHHLGFVATCNPEGAGKWPASFSRWFGGAEIVLIADNDEAGRKHVQDVAAKLYGTAKRVRLLELPDLPPKGDVSDWLAAGGSKEKLIALADERAVEWMPPAPAVPVEIQATSERPEAIAETEDDMAQRVADVYGDRMRYDHGRGCWYLWRDNRWEADGTNAGLHAARMICRQYGGGEEKLAKASAAAGVERFSRADPVFAVTPAQWDRDPFLLGTPGGTVDLRSGELRVASREDYITKVTAVPPAAPGTPHPLWSRFLAEATRGDEGLQRFMQQICGYALTGDIREHALFFLHGDGGNGKGVFLNAVTTIQGDYAATAAMDTFTASKNDRHPTDLAMLRGARLVSASETEEGRPWAESLIKRLTGGDPITARFMRQDFFTYMPQFKLLIIGNHKPVLRNVDEAMRRRFNMIPFVHKPAEKDPRLGEKLVEEYPAILRWMIDGCLDWQANGLVRPEVVREATEEYFSDQDLLGQWLDECCEQGNSYSESTRLLFDSWSKWAAEAGERPGTEVKFSAALVKRFRKVRHLPGRRGVRGFLGVRVRAVDTSGQWQDRLDRDD